MISTFQLKQFNCKTTKNQRISVIFGFLFYIIWKQSYFFFTFFFKILARLINGITFAPPLKNKGAIRMTQ